MSRGRRSTEPGARGASRRSQGDFRAAAPLLRAALAIEEQRIPRSDARLAAALNALGLVCKDLAWYEEGREAYQRALALLEGGDELDSVATLYHNLGGIEHARGNFAAGVALARRGLALRSRSREPDAISLAADQAALAGLLDGLGDYDEAERLYREALTVFEATAEPTAVELAATLNGLGAQYARRGRLVEAEALLARAVAVKQRVLGPGHADTAVSLSNLAWVLRRRGALGRADELHAHALGVFERTLGVAHPKTIACAASARGPRHGSVGHVAGSSRPRCADPPGIEPAGPLPG